MYIPSLEELWKRDVKLPELSPNNSANVRFSFGVSEKDPREVFFATNGVEYAMKLGYFIWIKEGFEKNPYTSTGSVTKRGFSSPILTAIRSLGGSWPHNMLSETYLDKRKLEIDFKSTLQIFREVVLDKSTTKPPTTKVTWDIGRILGKLKRQKGFDQGVQIVNTKNSDMSIRDRIEAKYGKLHRIRGRILKDIRRRASLNQIEVARAIGVSNALVSMWERNIGAAPNHNRIIRFIVACDPDITESR